jgi:hypothetical protein
LTEVTRYCPKHRDQTFKPSKGLVPSKSRYGYDIIVETGRLRFAENRQLGEISSEYARRGIRIPERTVQWLCDRYLQYLTAVHWESLNRLSQLVRERGGYVLHVDGSGSGGPMVLLLKDGWSGIHLLTAPISHETAEQMVPHIRVIRERFGNPVAVVADMNGNVWSAVRDVFPETYIIICHFHFLRNVAMKLFESVYPRFRYGVNRCGVKRRLRVLRRLLRRKNGLTEEEGRALDAVEYILDYRKDARGLPYPFSMPDMDFYQRCSDVEPTIRDAILERASRNTVSPRLARLQNYINRERWHWFRRIRVALRYRNGPIPLSTNVSLSDGDLEKGRRRLDWVMGKIGEFERRIGLEPHEMARRKALRKVGNMILDYRENLFAPNVLVKSNGIDIVRKLPRTNTPEEYEFRKARRHSRRIRGNSNVERQFQRDGPGILLANNLTNRSYVRCVYGTMDQMAERFAKVGEESLSIAKSYMGAFNGPSAGDNRRLQ